MSHRVVKKILPLVIGIFLVLGLNTGVVAAAAPKPDTKPFFQVNGGDVFTGGWFNTDSNTCSNDVDSDYQAPITDNNGSLTNNFAGGILTFGYLDSSKNPPAVGASTNQAVFSLGGIGRDSTNQYGFMSPGANGSQLTFANSSGGKFEGSIRQTHCIPDYYNTKVDLPKLWDQGSINPTSGQYYANGSGNTPIKINGGNISSGKNITILINGNAYISGDIGYAAIQSIDSIPKFALLVKGNIYIDPSVSLLTGFYIAQPQANNSGGVIYTCHDKNSDETPSTDYLSRSCRTSLTINGAVVARDVEFDRTKGDINGKGGSAGPAEVINYTPEMVLGGSFFHGVDATSTQAKIDSIISLPPVF